VVKIHAIITVDNFLEIVAEVLKSNPTYAGHTFWHPEDLQYALACVSEDVVNTLVALNKRGLLLNKEAETNEVHDSSK
jgi:hypothetical protein